MVARLRPAPTIETEGQIGDFLVSQGETARRATYLTSGQVKPLSLEGFTVQPLDDKTIDSEGKSGAFTSPTRASKTHQN